MATTRSARVSTGVVIGLVAAIVVADIVGNVMAPEAARVPLKLGILVALIVWARRYVGLSWDELGLGRAHLGAGLRLGGVAAAIVAAVIALLVLDPSTRSSFESTDIAHASTTRQLLMVLVVIPLGTVLFEEMIFRGVLLGVLLRAWARRTAVVVSAVLFGCWHLVPAVSDADGHSGAAIVGVVVGTVAVTTAAGVLFAWLRLRSESLAAPVLAHVATNSLAYIGAVIVLHR